MNDYSTLETLISSTVVAVAAVAFLFGKLTSDLKIAEYDKDTHTIDGLVFLFYYAFLPLVGIVIIELYMQNTKDTFWITARLLLLLTFQPVLLLIHIYIYWKFEPIMNYLKPRKSLINTFFKWVILTIYQKAWVRGSLIWIQAICTYIIIKSHFSRHILLFGVSIPANFDMRLYVILAIIISFVSLIVVRFTGAAAKFKTDTITVQMNDGTTEEGKLLKMGRYIVIYDDNRILSINENNIKSMEQERRPMN